MIKTFLTLLPRGSLFSKIGKRLYAFIKAICWQFDQVLNFYRIMGRQGFKNPPVNIELLAEEFNIDIADFTDSEAVELFKFLTYMPMNGSRKSFFDTLLNLFPRLETYRGPTAYLDCEEGQLGLFEVSRSELGGFSEKAPRKDHVYVSGIVKNLADKRRLTWFLERYDRAKHKHIIAVTSPKALANGMCDCNEIGVFTVGGFSIGPL